MGRVQGGFALVYGAVRCIGLPRISFFFSFFLFPLLALTLLRSWRLEYCHITLLMKFCFSNMHSNVSVFGDNAPHLDNENASRILLDTAPIPRKMLPRESPNAPTTPEYSVSGSRVILQIGFCQGKPCV